MPSVPHSMNQDVVSRCAQGNEDSTSLMECQTVATGYDSLDRDRERHVRGLVKSSESIERQVEEAQARHSEVIEKPSSDDLSFQHGDMLGLKRALMPADLLAHLLA